MKPSPSQPITLALLSALVLACNGTSAVDTGSELDDLPTQEELDAQASEEIDQDNADEAFRELQEEIDTDE